MKRELVYFYGENRRFNLFKPSERRRSALTMLHGKLERGPEEVGLRQVKPSAPPSRHSFSPTANTCSGKSYSILYFILFCYLLYNRQLYIVFFFQRYTLMHFGQMHVLMKNIQNKVLRWITVQGLVPTLFAEPQKLPCLTNLMLKWQVLQL